MARFNFLIHEINHKIARDLPYRGIVVDLGCGTSPYYDMILQKADRYIGLDWPGSLHQLSKLDAFADVSCGVPLKDGYADTVVAFQVMEHLREPALFLAECQRILKPEGQLFLTVPFMWHVHEPPYDFFRYTRYGLAYMLEQAGFVDLQIIENSGFWQMWVLKFNYHTARLARGPAKLFFWPIWIAGQLISPLLDKYDRHPQETVSYTVMARKPACR